MIIPTLAMQLEGRVAPRARTRPANWRIQPSLAAPGSPRCARPRISEDVFIAVRPERRKCGTDAEATGRTVDFIVQVCAENAVELTS
jgi:hypothetical protein